MIKYKSKNVNFNLIMIQFFICFQEELSGLLGKVKEVISENEGLQERQKSGVLRSVLDYLQPSDREDDDEEEDDTEASEVSSQLLLQCKEENK
jgi:hypothetical protein